MKPSLSIVFFTVSSGAGLGLLSLVALADLWPSQPLPARALARGVALALVFIVAGLASSALHLAKPSNAWRAFSRFRTSWLSREAVFAAALVVVGLLYWGAVASGMTGALRGSIAVAALALSWAVLVCTAMIYASLRAIRQWHTRWTPLNYILLGHWSGSVLLLGLARLFAADPTPFAWLAGGIGVAALLAKVGYWRAAADDATALTLERAIGVREGVRPPGMTIAQARLLDTGHSHRTFLTDEFGFSLARQHAKGLRILAVGFGFGLPAAWILAPGGDGGRMIAAAAFCIIGLLAERWLFFAEARHTVRLYHGDSRT
ncbi:MAG TPA: DmsC/YnfH family molybdoenzyme membrane anchor subunit [Casimicrobiaceae bacterium]|nr:DmsC/YnfH family molybdoenzyme membrane anchor subunit [Casimicrobiaceae bacterium]